MNERAQILSIPGEPVPKQSTRFLRGHGVTPERVKLHAAKVQLFAKIAKVRRLSVPLRLEISFYLGNARRVDLDNLLKGVLDPLNGIAWDDDSQVMHLETHKVIDRENPRTVMQIWPVTE